MKHTMKRMLALLLVLGLVTTAGPMALAEAPAAKGADGAVKVYFDRPDGVEVSLYSKITAGNIRGYTINDADLIAPDPVDGHYLLSEVGAYLTIAQGDGYYTVAKPFWLSEEKKEEARKNGGELHIDADPGKVVGEGYNQADPSREGGEQGAAPMQWTRDANVLMVNEEILAAGFSTEELRSYPEGGYPTPAFTTEKGAHEYSSNEDLAALIKQLDAADADNIMHPYIAGYSAQYKFPMHAVIFSQTADIPDGVPLETAAQILVADSEANSKPTVFIGAQVHGNEISAGEGGMAYMTELMGDYGEETLKYVNAVVMPRLNPDGAYMTHRYSTEMNFDMNRDQMMLQLHEDVVAMSVFNMFMPHLLIDMHEMQANYLGAEGMNGTDIWVNGATMTATGTLTDWVHEFEQDIVDKLIYEGLDPLPYQPYTNTLLRSAFHGLTGAVPMLLEIRGNGLGRDYYGRRTHSHVMGAKSAVPSTKEEADELLKVVTEWREETITQGGIYDDADPILLEISQSGNMTKDFYRPFFGYDGSENPRVRTYTYYDTVERSRTRPTAYLIEAPVAEAEGPDRYSHTSIVEILDNHGIEYYYLEPGTTVEQLRQSYAVSTSGRKVTEAGLRDAADITFADGAYFIPMDQLKNPVVAYLMEQDFTHNADANSRGTLHQRGYLTLDGENDLPIYHYTADNPRALLD